MACYYTLKSRNQIRSIKINRDIQKALKLNVKASPITLNQFFYARHHRKVSFEKLRSDTISLGYPAKLRIVHRRGTQARIYAKAHP